MSDSFRPPTDQEISRLFGPRAALRGAQYQSERRVTLTGVREGGRYVDARVRGSEREPYEVEVELQRLPEGLNCLSTCGCPVGGDCKHVAAVLFEIQRHGLPRSGAPSGEAPAVPADEETLSPRVGEWLAALDFTIRRDGEIYPPKVRDRLRYVLRLSRFKEQPQLVVNPVRVTLGADGGIAKDGARAFPLGQAVAGKAPAFLRVNDLEILAVLHDLDLNGAQYVPGGVVLSGTIGARLLEQILRTGRAHWDRGDGPALASAPARDATIVWQADESGGQRLSFGGDGVDMVLPVTPPWFVDATTGACGPIETALPPHVAGSLAVAPPVPNAAAPLLAVELARRFPDQREAILRAAGRTRHIATRPVVRLRLATARLDHQSRQHGGRAESEPGIDVILATLGFDYDGETVLPQLEAKTISRRHGADLVVIERDIEAERAVLKELERAGMHQATGWASGYRLDAEQRTAWIRPSGPDGTLAGAFVSETLPRWETAGWQLEYAPDWPYSFVDLEGDLSIDITESSGLDWFEFDLGAMVDGERVNLLPALGPLFDRLGESAHRVGVAEALAELARAGAKVVIALADGRRARLPVARLLPLLTTLVELLAGGLLTKGGRVRLPRLRAAELAALEAGTLEATRLRWLGGERLRELGRRLADFSSIAPVDPPKGFKGELRAYQRDGLSWLQFLRGYGLNGILADDMGLGKTVQTLAHLLVEKVGRRADRPSLVIAPTSLIPNWRLEARRFAPALRVVVWHGPDRAAETLGDSDLVLTSYALLARDRETLAGRPWHLVILDEAQAIKNPQSIATQAVQTLDARHRLCLTGTPLENHLGELWSLMNFLNPGLLGDRARFSREFRQPIEKRGDAERRDTLARRVRPFLLRRTKDAVERDLPPKTEIIERLELEPHQRDVYESVRLAAYGRVREEIAAKGLARSHIVVLDALLKLRQVCCDPRLLKLSRGTKDAGSAKLARLMEMLPELLEEGRRVLVFSQFTSMLALIEAQLVASGIDFVRLTGETTDRTTPVRRFQSGEVPVFLISLKAGGVGLNLTAADTVILFDPWWNPAVEAQAIDRAHRIGQSKPVFAYRLLTIGTVEEKMLELQGRKRALADALLSGSATASSQITEADLEALFAPLGESESEAAS
ncbi:MAG: DEAD/DEAH box helicase [Alphaproteobacteria bacterium]|nr:DEAD/DEAH box helicase [Alphaproteobacteria bacterium]